MTRSTLSSSLPLAASPLHINISSGFPPTLSLAFASIGYEGKMLDRGEDEARGGAGNLLTIYLIHN